MQLSFCHNQQLHVIPCNWHLSKQAIGRYSIQLMLTLSLELPPTTTFTATTATTTTSTTSTATAATALTVQLHVVPLV